MAKLEISWNIVDEKSDSFKDDFAASQLYNPGNGETRDDFIKRTVGEYMQRCVKIYRVEKARKAAEEAEKAKADDILT